MLTRSRTAERIIWLVITLTLASLLNFVLVTRLGAQGTGNDTIQACEHGITHVIRIVTTYIDGGDIHRDTYAYTDCYGDSDTYRGANAFAYCNTYAGTGMDYSKQSHHYRPGRQRMGKG